MENSQLDQKAHQWATEIKAIDPKDGEIKTWAGPHIWAVSIEDANQFCQENGLGYCTAVAQLG